VNSITERTVSKKQHCCQGQFQDEDQDWKM
jgi:hypothetical protein